jgi:hypothetical protein
MSEKKLSEIKVEIKLDEETAQGVYANLAVVNHNDSEFVIDFVFVQPQAPQAKVRSRVVTSPRHVKRLIQALEDNLKTYEKSFGTVNVSGASTETFGKYH